MKTKHFKVKYESAGPYQMSLTVAFNPDLLRSVTLMILLKGLVDGVVDDGAIKK